MSPSEKHQIIRLCKKHLSTAASYPKPLTSCDFARVSGSSFLSAERQRWSWAWLGVRLRGGCRGERVQAFALNDRAAGGGEDSTIIFLGPSLKSLAQFCSLWRPSPVFLSSFPSSFRLYVQRILFICQIFQHTKHCTTLCTIYQRAESSMEPGFGLELGLVVSLSQIHLYITHCRAIVLTCCLFLFPSMCLLLSIISILMPILRQDVLTQLIYQV